MQEKKKKRGGRGGKYLVSGGDDEKEMEKNTWKRIDEKNGRKGRKISWKRKNCCGWADGWRYIKGSSIGGPNGSHIPPFAKKSSLGQVKKARTFSFQVLSHGYTGRPQPSLRVT